MKTSVWKHEHEYTMLVGDVYLSVSFDSRSTHVYVDCGNGDKLSKTFGKCDKKARRRMIRTIERALVSVLRERGYEIVEGGYDES